MDPERKGRPRRQEKGTRKCAFKAPVAAEGSQRGAGRPGQVSAPGAQMEVVWQVTRSGSEASRKEAGRSTEVAFSELPQEIFRAAGGSGPVKAPELPKVPG